MEDIDYLYNQISKTETTLIGYRFSDERIKDEIISNLGRTKTIDLGSYFSMKSILRDMKIDQVLNEEEKFDYLLLDINDIRNSYIEQRNFTNEDISRAGIIKNIIDDIRSGLRDNGNDIKLILTCPLNTTMSSSHKSGLESFVGGSAPLYCSDLGLMITQKNDEKIIKIIKNRNGDSDKIIKYDSIKL